MVLAATRSRLKVIRNTVKIVIVKYFIVLPFIVWAPVKTNEKTTKWI